jgi:hypothetical protein
LTPRISRRSVEFVMDMRRIANFQRQAVATVILLAILIAPLCAPLCGSRACANSSTQREDCHGSATANAETQPTNLGTARACALGELPTAALKEASSPERLRQVFAPHASANFLVASQSAPIVVNSAAPYADSEPHPKKSSVQATILRV